jgi:hypothetical protein
MNVLAIVPATLAPHGEGIHALTKARGEPLLGHVLDRLERVSKSVLTHFGTTTGYSLADILAFLDAQPSAG